LALGRWRGRAQKSDHRHRWLLRACRLELLKEIAPSVTRAAVPRDPTFAAGMGQFAAIQAVGPIGVDVDLGHIRILV
jgi:hypothetical protein